MDIPSSMDGEDHSAQDPDFTTPSWMEMEPFTSPHNSPPLPDYHGLMYGTSPILPEAPYGMSIPPPYASLSLPLPSHPWPSMLTTQSHLPETFQPPVPIPPSKSRPVRPAPGRRSSGSGSNPRKTLTDEDRRRMCLYHEENKTAKQTDIGAIFGVERSTVSKVLRHKDKYLNQDDESRSPIKRQKGRIPDIEKALSNWARNYQRQGYSLTDDSIREKARVFASTCGSPDGMDKALDEGWLENFKVKYNLTGGKSRRVSSSTKGDDKSLTRLDTSSTAEATTQTSTAVSPASSRSSKSPFSLSPSQLKADVKKEPAEDLECLASEFQPANSKSTTSLDTASASGIVEGPASTMPSDTIFSSSSRSHITPVTINDTSSSQVTAVDSSVMSGEVSYEQKQAKRAVQQSLSLSILESPLEEEELKFDSHLESSTSAKTADQSDSQTRLMFRSPFIAHSDTVSPVSSPGSPTQDEARKALELVMNYFQHQPSGLGAQDFMTIGKLMEKLELAKNQQNSFPRGLTPIGELHDTQREEPPCRRSQPPSVQRQSRFPIMFFHCKTGHQLWIVVVFAAR